MWNKGWAAVVRIDRCAPGDRESFRLEVVCTQHGERTQTVGSGCKWFWYSITYVRTRAADGIMLQVTCLRGEEKENSMRKQRAWHSKEVDWRSG